MTKPGSSKTTDDQLVENSESLCGHCRKLVKNESPAMECEICQQWYHIKCQGIKKAEYESIKGGGKRITSVNYTGIVKLVREWQ